MTSKTAGRRSGGQIVPRGDNKYLLRVYVGQSDAGKNQYVSRVFNGTISDARKELTKMQRESDTKTLVRSSKVTVKELITTWLESKKVLPQTLKNYETTLKANVFPQPLARMRITDVERQHVQALYNTMEKDGYAHRQIEYVHMLLNQAFELAVIDNKIVRNPCNHTERGGPMPEKKGAEVVLTPAQVAQFFAKNADDPLYAMWLLFLTTGMRPQEVLPLRWSDIDGAYLKVNRVLAVVGGKQIIQEGRAKTGDSNRPIALSESVLKALKAQRARVAEMRLKYGEQWHDLDLVFPGRQGRCKDLQAVRRNWRDALIHAELPELRLYSARHSHITHLIEAGVAPAVVAARVGNSAAITLKVYTHVGSESKDKLATLTDELLFKKAVGEK